MAIKLSEQAKKKLLEKFENPDRKVVCPLCGEELIFHSIGNSSEVYCPTKNCIHAAIRGI